MTGDADYRKINDRSLNSSTYHKKDSTAVRAKLKHEAKKEVTAGIRSPSSGLLYCDDCKWLNPKEHEQSKNKEPHMCKIFKTSRLHYGFHPQIPRPKRCKFYEKI